MTLRSGRRCRTPLLALSILSILAGSPQAGSLDPSGPPGPTMKTLDEIPPAWSQRIAGPARFRPALDGLNAVLDRETGLVWQKGASDANWGWGVAQTLCVVTPIAQRLGWRLPTAEELYSLLDPTQPAAPFLPGGHPFGAVGGVYWTSTTNANNTAAALAIDFSAASFVFLHVDVSKAAGFAKVWCVRGGQGYEAR